MEDLDSHMQEQDSEFVCSANEVVDMKLVRTGEDVMSEKVGFRPEFTHQFFGDNEKIFGYKNIKVKLCFHACHLTPYAEVTYNEMVPEDEGALPDDVMAKLAEIFGDDFFGTNRDSYMSALAKEIPFEPLGELQHEFTVGGDDATYCVHKCTVDTKGLVDYHEKVQVFSMFFIDACSLIDLTDPRWNFFYVWRKEKLAGQTSYTFVGYSTTYNFYHYPDSTLTRISQFLVLPPFQKKGIGRTLLSQVYADCMARPEVVEITVEDPSETFLYLRDTVDLSCCLESVGVPPLGPLTNEFTAEVQNKLKRAKLQIRRLHEMLLLKGLDRRDPKAYKDYRLIVKKRLYTNYQDELEQLKEDKRELHRFLADRYNEIENYYGRVVNAVAAM
eukprot:comp20505_c0_seq1/m.26217 comp20505_c0_seq1/g.26217  ORF comp20505_c0_seq1/g.26217 comp20505_c0_seq1/m.26217 type:complete len:386 (-) comp20505_c0_seq1:527-1684(-)